MENKISFRKSYSTGKTTFLFQIAYFIIPYKLEQHKERLM